VEKAAAGRGLLTINPERDGIVRRVPMIMLAQSETMPSLSFRDAAGGDGYPTPFSSRAMSRAFKSLGVKGFQIPTDLKRPALGAFFAVTIRPSSSRHST